MGRPTEADRELLAAAERLSGLDADLGDAAARAWLHRVLEACASALVDVVDGAVRPCPAQVRPLPEADGAPARRPDRASCSALAQQLHTVVALLAERPPGPGVDAARSGLTLAAAALQQLVQDTGGPGADLALARRRLLRGLRVAADAADAAAGTTVCP